MVNTWGLEAMEPRLLLSAPEVNVPSQLVFDANRGAFTMPISAYDAEGHALSISVNVPGAASDYFDVQIVQNSTFAKLTFAILEVWQGVIAGDSVEEGQTLVLSVTQGIVTSFVTYTVTEADMEASSPYVLALRGLEDAWNEFGLTGIVAYTTGANFYLYAAESFSVAVDSGTADWESALTVQEAGEGTLLVELFTGRPVSAAAAQRFIDLSTTWPTDGVGGTDPEHSPWYFNSPSHRIMQGFMLQCGGQYNESGNLINSPLPNLTDSFDSLLSFVTRGLMAMANTGQPNSSNTQWFIMDGENTNLDGRYTIFGQMIGGWEFFDVLVSTPVTLNAAGSEKSVPIATPFLKSVEILEPDDPDATSSFTLIITPKTEFGGTWALEITLDDGQGGVTTHVVDVTTHGLAWFGDNEQGDGIANIRMSPGGARTFDLSTVIDGRDITVAIAEGGVGLNAAAVTYDPFSQTLTIKTPSSFNGTFAVVFSVVMETEGGVKTTTYPSFYVISAIPNAPEYTYTRPTAVADAPTSTCVSGNLLFVAHGNSGVMIYDISDAASPRFVTQVQTYGNVWDVKVVGDVMYITEWDVIVDYYQGWWPIYSHFFETWDISDLNNVTLLGAIEVADDQAVPCGFVVYSGFAFVAEYGNGIVTYDVSDPKNIKRVSTISTFSFPWDINSKYTLANCVDVAANGNYLYVSDLYWGIISVMSIAKSGRLTFVNFVQRKGMNPWGLEVQNGVLYVGDRNLGLLTFDVSKKDGMPRFLGMQSLAYATNLRLADVTVDGVTKKYAVVAVQEGTAFVDVTNVKNPQLVYISSTGDGGRTPAIVGSLAYVLSGDGMVIMDMSGLRNITLVKNATFEYETEGGSVVVVTVKLVGAGGIIKPSDDGFDPLSVFIIGGSGGTTVTVTTVGGIWAPGSVVTFGTIKSFTAMTTQAAELAFSGISTLKLGDLPNGGRIDLGWGLIATTVTLGHVDNLSLISQSDIKTLSVKSWMVTNRNPDEKDRTHVVLQARSVQKLTCPGEFSPDVKLFGYGADSPYFMQVLKSATIGGPIHDAMWDLIGSVGTLSVKGVIAGWDAWFMILNKGTFGVVTGSLREGDALLTAGSSLIVAGYSYKNYTGKVVGVAALGTLTASSWTGGSISALCLTTLTIRGEMTGDLKMIGDGEQFDRIGRAGRVTVGSWEIGDITARSIAQLTVKGALGANLSIDGGSDSAVNLPRVTVGSVTGGLWHVTGGIGTMTVSTGVSDWVAIVDGIRTLTVRKGDMADVQLTVTRTVGTISVKGSLRDSEITLMEPASLASPKFLTLGKFTVGGAMENTTLVSAGHIGSVTLGAMLGGNIAAGLKPGTYVAVTIDDFTDTGARIDNFTIKGLKGAKGEPAPAAFSGWVSATELGKVKLVNADIITEAEAPVEFGLSAMTMKSFSYKDATRKESWTPRSANPWPGSGDDYGNFVIRRV